MRTGVCGLYSACMVGVLATIAVMRLVYDKAYTLRLYTDGAAYAKNPLNLPD